jgi:predicted ATP-dependent protease
LYVLLSAIGNAPIRQSLAVTGSVDQLGRVQAIGGVNEKIEGFFDLCNERGLTGDQGVMIPSSNVKHLMLRQEVVDAVATCQFHVYPIEHVDQGMELLTGLEAGERDKKGKYPKGSVNRLVEDRLIAIDNKRRALERKSQPKADKQTDNKGSLDGDGNGGSTAHSAYGG